MSTAQEDRPDDGNTATPPSAGEQEHAGRSGEGAASALEHLKSQKRQQRSHISAGEEGPSA